MNNKKIDKSLTFSKKQKRIFRKKNNDIDEDINDKKLDIKKEVEVRKTGFNFVEVIIITVIASMIGLLVGCFATYVSFDDGRVIGCSSVRKDTEEFSKVYDNMLNEYYGGTDRKGLLKAAIVGMVDYLDDPYAEYLESSEAIELSEKLAGEFIGVGIEITMEDGGKTTVVNVYNDSPASVAGIMPGDIIVKFNDVLLEGLSSKELSETIVTDTLGKDFVLTVRRRDKELVFNITSNLIKITSVSSYVKEVESKKIGYISITSFAENTFEQFKTHYDELKDENISGLVIDVRGNAGDDLDSAKKITELFLDKGDIIFQKDINGKIEYVLSETDKEIDINVVIVTDKCTASASEIFVSSLKENLLCDVVGIETYGKGTIQKMYELSDGSYIKFTTQKWLTSNGADVNEIGIAPTHYVAFDKNIENNQYVKDDNQLDYAFRLFK